MRLTEKDYCGYDIKNRELENDYTDEEIFNALQRLGQYEDIDEKLGVDLFLFSKIIKQQFVFVKIGEKISSKYDFIGINFNQNNALILYNEDNQEMYTSDLYFEDYGKTWALTKEELI